MRGRWRWAATFTTSPPARRRRRAYEFAWNDDVIAMNQFAGVLRNATEGVAAALNTEAKGIAWWFSIR